MTRSDTGPLYFMALDVLRNILSRAHDLATTAEYVSTTMRELSGARVVGLLAEESAPGRGDGRVLFVSPERQRAFFGAERVRTIQELGRGRSSSGYVFLRATSDPAAFARLTAADHESVLVLSLPAGPHRVGAIVLFDLPEQGERIHEVLAFMEPLKTLLGLVLNQALLVERQETVIEERTRSLARREALVSSLLASTAEGIYGIDLSGTCTFVNKACLRLLGYDREDELVGKDLHRISHHSQPDGRILPSHQCRIRHAMEESTEVHVADEVFWRRDGTSFPVEYWAHPLGEPGRSAGVVVSFIDITERRHAEAERRRLEDQLFESQKLEAIGTLAGGIAHDFNNILTPVMGHAELALLRLGEQDPVREDIAELLTAAGRAAELVRQILVISRKEPAGPLVPVPLGPLVREVTKFLRASLPSTIEIQTDVDPVCGPVVGELAKFHQVLLNLCTNAGYAMRERGGVLAVSLSPFGEGRVRLAVRDTGEGIPPDVVGRIFEPYFTTKPTGKGSGLGLAVARAIVARFGGVIRVESEPGAGSLFEVILPEAERTPPPSAATLPEVPLGKGQTVLVVDDEAPVLQVLARILTALDYRAIPCASGAEALERVQASPGAFDAVVTDYTMPGMTGLDLAARLQAVRPDLPVVLSTGFSEAVDDRTVESRGLRALVFKPYTIQKMAEALRKALGR